MKPDIKTAVATLFFVAAQLSNAADAPWPTFTDVTEAAGIKFKHNLGDVEMTNIVEATDRTLAFVKQFLANAAAEHGLTLERKSVNLGALADDVVREHQPANIMSLPAIRMFGTSIYTSFHVIMTINFTI